MGMSIPKLDKIIKSKKKEKKIRTTLSDSATAPFNDYPEPLALEPTIQFPFNLSCSRAIFPSRPHPLANYAYVINYGSTDRDTRQDSGHRTTAFMLESPAYRSNASLEHLLCAIIAAYSQMLACFSSISPSRICTKSPECLKLPPCLSELQLIT